MACCRVVRLVWCCLYTILFGSSAQLYNNAMVVAYTGRWVVRDSKSLVKSQHVMLYTVSFQKEHGQGIGAC